VVIPVLAQQVALEAHVAGEDARLHVDAVAFVEVVARCGLADVAQPRSGEVAASAHTAIEVLHDVEHATRLQLDAPDDVLVVPRHTDTGEVDLEFATASNAGRTHDGVVARAVVGLREVGVEVQTAGDVLAELQRRGTLTALSIHPGEVGVPKGYLGLGGVDRGFLHT